MRKISIATAVLFGLGLGGMITQNRFRGPGSGPRNRSLTYAPSGTGERERARRRRQIARHMLTHSSRGYRFPYG